MLKKIKFKISLAKLLKYFYILTLIAAAILLGATTKFLYSNFYLAITQSDVILSLSEKVVDETVNMDKFDAIMKKIEDKTKARDLGEISNPF